jgi:hypothetical protein
MIGGHEVRPDGGMLLCMTDPSTGDSPDADPLAQVPGAPAQPVEQPAQPAEHGAAPVWQPAPPTPPTGAPPWPSAQRAFEPPAQRAFEPPAQPAFEPMEQPAFGPPANVSGPIQPVWQPASEPPAGAVPPAPGTPTSGLPTSGAPGFPTSPPSVYPTSLPTGYPTSQPIGYPTGIPTSPAAGTGPWPVPLAAPAPPNERRKLGLLIAVIAGALVLLVALGGGAYVLSRKTSSTPRAGAAAASSPSAKPMTPEAYQDALTTADTKLTDALKPVREARVPGTTSTAVGGLRTVLLSETTRLGDLTPPAAMRDAHDALMKAMRDFTIAVADVFTLVDDRRICAGVSAMAKITSMPTAATLRNAVQDLGTADSAHQYKFGAFLPAAAADEFRQLANGTYLKKVSGGGSNRFKLENKSASDAVVSLVPTGGAPALFILYVRGNATSTASGIKNGTYDVFLSQGVDWEPAISAFTRNCSYEKFTQTLTFKATSTRYEQWTITLGGAGSGNEAPTDDIDPNAFPTG